MSKIVAMFDSGAGVEVSVQHEQLVLNVFLPIEFVVRSRSFPPETVALSSMAKSPCFPM